MSVNVTLPPGLTATGPTGDTDPPPLTLTVNVGSVTVIGNDTADKERIFWEFSVMTCAGIYPLVTQRAGTSKIWPEGVYAVHPSMTPSPSLSTPKRTGRPPGSVA